jgi:hypothetical protein
MRVHKKGVISDLKGVIRASLLPTSAEITSMKQVRTSPELVRLGRFPGRVRRRQRLAHRLRPQLAEDRPQGANARRERVSIVSATDYHPVRLKFGDHAQDSLLAGSRQPERLTEGPNSATEGRKPLVRRTSPRPLTQQGHVLKVKCTAYPSPHSLIPRQLHGIDG